MFELKLYLVIVRNALLFLIFLVASCHHRSGTQFSANKPAFKQDSVQPTAEKKPGLPASNYYIDSNNSKTDSTLLQIDSVKIYGNLYVGFIKGADINADTFYLVRNHRDTVIKFSSFSAPGFSFTDFNRDGFSDIQINYVMQTPDVEDVFLFDKASESFIQIKGLEDFPEPRPVYGSKYFYSYHHSGCADADWDSDLFTIENFKATTVGNIHAQGCKDEPNGIAVYKICNGKKHFYEKLAAKAVDAGKWDMIEDYWTHHYRQFNCH